MEGAFADNASEMEPQVLGACDMLGIDEIGRRLVDDLGLKRPSLDDVFLHLTGHRAEAEVRDAGEQPTDVHAGDDRVEVAG